MPKEKLIIAIFCVIVLAISVYPQSSEKEYIWQKIVLLKSDCEDIKRVFKVKECEIPFSRYRLTAYTLYVNFSTGMDKWNVERGKVVSMAFSLNFLNLKLKDFERDFSDYTIRSNDTLDLVYTNEKKGIELLVVEKSKEKWIREISIFPAKDCEKKICPFDIEEGWKGVLPLKMNRVEFERLIQLKSKNKGNFVDYETKNVLVSVVYSEEPCSNDN